MIQLTAREKALLLAMPSFQYVQDEYFASGSGAWGWSLVDDIAGALGVSLRSAKGNVASLTNKGVFNSSFDPEYKKDGHWVFITDAGYEAYLEVVAEATEAAHAEATQDATEAANAPAAEAEAAEPAASAQPSQAADKLTARQRVFKAEDGWHIVGSTFVYDLKRQALRKAAQLNRES
jgi:DNA-binding MarR family transcriptional regulator